MKSDIDFCLCWANENWTRKWDASENEVLIAQTYSPENDIAFIEGLLPLFRDRRYMRVNGAPLLVVYRPQEMPDARATAERWRRHCREAGIGEIHLVAALTHWNDEFECFGFDAGLDFPPHNVANVVPNNAENVCAFHELKKSCVGVRRLRAGLLVARIRDAAGLPRRSPRLGHTARTGTSAHLLVNDTPANYEQWLDAASHLTTAERAPGERLVFINAWNEWAEGCHLEPDRKHGRGYLEATRRVKTGRAAAGPRWDISGWNGAPQRAPDGKTQQPTVLSTRVAVGTASA